MPITSAIAPPRSRVPRSDRYIASINAVRDATVAAAEPWSRHRNSVIERQREIRVIARPTGREGWAAGGEQRKWPAELADQTNVGTRRARPPNRIAGLVGDLGPGRQPVVELVRDRQPRLPD